MQAAVGVYGLIAVLALGLLWRRVKSKQPGAKRALVSTLIGIAGAVVCVLGVANEGTPLMAIGSVLLGLYWLDTGVTLQAQGARKLGWLTIILGVVALLVAVDSGLWMLPWTPISPAWVFLLLAIIWLPWALVAALRRARAQHVMLPTIPAGAARAN